MFASVPPINQQEAKGQKERRIPCVWGSFDLELESTLAAHRRLLFHQYCVASRLMLLAGALKNSSCSSPEGHSRAKQHLLPEPGMYVAPEDLPLQDKQQPSLSVIAALAFRHCFTRKAWLART
jgi:hypothetical protein